jgi:hypothetical protein
MTNKWQKKFEMVGKINWGFQIYLSLITSLKGFKCTRFAAHYVRTEYFTTRLWIFVEDICGKYKVIHSASNYVCLGVTNTSNIFKFICWRFCSWKTMAVIFGVQRDRKDKGLSHVTQVTVRRDTVLSYKAVTLYFCCYWKLFEATRRK